MARTKSPPPAIDAVPSDVNESLVADSAKHGELLAQHERGIAEIDARFGIDRPYDREVFIGLARDAVSVMSDRLYVIGRICIQLRAHEPHGSFGEALDSIGIAPRFAQKCMAAVRKIEGSEARKLLAGRLSSGKLLELLSEDDDDLEELANGGELYGKTLDDIEAMSTRELRAALRAERKEKDEEVAARDDIIARKDKKLQQLELKSRRLSKAPFREKLEAAMQEFNEIALAAQGGLDAMRAALMGLDDMHIEAGENYTADVLEVIDGQARSTLALANDIVELAKA